MVRIQRPLSYPDKLLIGSDQPDAPSARRELEQWVERNGYFLPEDACHFSVWEHGVLLREWVLVERLPTHARRFPLRALTGRLGRMRGRAKAA